MFNNEINNSECTPVLLVDVNYLRALLTTDRVSFVKIVGIVCAEAANGEEKLFQIDYPLKIIIGETMKSVHQHIPTLLLLILLEKDICKRQAELHRMKTPVVEGRKEVVLL